VESETPLTDAVLDAMLSSGGLDEIPAVARREIRNFLKRNKDAMVGIAVETLKDYLERLVAGETFASVQHDLLLTFSDRELIDFYKMNTDQMRQVKNRHFREAAILHDMVSVLTQIGLEALDLLIGNAIIALAA